MVDMNTFLTILYVMVDDFCKSRFPTEMWPGPKASLTRSEVATLAIFGQWYRFRSQRDFYRFARQKLCSAFPTLPHRSQYNRLVRKEHLTVVAFFMHLGELLEVRQAPYEIMDTSGVPVRNIKRRGRGWLAGDANIGWCTRLGWYFGFRVLISTNPEGAITGFGFGQGSAKEQPLAETMLALRREAHPAIPGVGRPALGSYLADAGFAGRRTHQRWQQLYGAEVITEPQTNSPIVWPKELRRWLHSHRQIVETAFAKLIDFFRLEKERPHELDGFQVTLAAKMTLHNFSIWLNKHLGRDPLAFADLLGW